MTLHANIACDVYLSFIYNRGLNSDDLERINFNKKRGVVKGSNGRGGSNLIIHHKHFVGDEQVTLFKDNGYLMWITIFVK